MKIAMRTRSGLLATATALGMLSLAGGAAAGTETQQPAAVAQPEASGTTADSVRVYVDPKTGKLRQATAEERAAEAQESAKEAKQRAGKRIKVVKLPSGTLKGVDTEGLLMESVLVTKNADGSLSYTFVDGDGSEAGPDPIPSAKLEEK